MAHWPDPIKIPMIASTVCEAVRVDLTDLFGRGRHPSTVLARELCGYLLRRHTDRSFPEIATLLGRPNHSTICTACRRVEARVAAKHVPTVELIEVIEADLPWVYAGLPRTEWMEARGFRAPAVQAWRAETAPRRVA